MNTNQSKTAREAEKAGAAAEATAETLAKEVAELRRDLEALVGQVGKVGRAGVEDAKRTAQAKVAEGKEVGERIVSEISSEWEELDRRVVTATQANPWRSLGIAALAGVVLGMILRR